MEIGNIVHKGVKRLYHDGSGKGLPAQVVEKIEKMLGFLEAMSDESELESLPVWRPHRLTGDRKGMWSLTVTKNWRLTFSIDTATQTVCDIDFEDYH